MTGDTNTVLLTENLGELRILTLNRPHVLNAVNGALARALDQALTDADDDPSVRVVILAGTHRAFCAGVDLKAITAEGNQVHIKGKGFAGIAHRERVKPLICAVEGLAFGGGFEICLSADMVTASSAATFALTEVLRSRLAVGGGLLRLGRALPRAIAMEMNVVGYDPFFTAERAFTLGLVNRVTTPGDALAAAVELAEAVAAGAPLSVQGTKKIIDAASTASRDREREVWALSLTEFSTVRASNDSREGTEAFLEKRAPRWTGR